jgi:hypothetical protein
MDQVTTLLGVVLVACGLLGWLASIHLSRRRKRSPKVTSGAERQDPPPRDHGEETPADHASST